MPKMVKEGKGRVPVAAHREGLRVARLLAEKIEAAGLSVRRVEELVGWGQKTLQQILNGEQPIRVSHVAAVLETLELDLKEFYRELANPNGAEAAKESQAVEAAEPRNKEGKDRRKKEKPLNRTRDYQMVQALLERSWSLRFSDPEGVVLAASMAVVVAERIGVTTIESEELADLQARAWVELGNAYRVSDDLATAEAAFARALEIFGRGTEDLSLLARLMDLTASLRIDQRRFSEAHHLLDWAYSIYKRSGDSRFASRSLISKGYCFRVELQPEDGLRFLVQGVNQLDARQEPTLVFLAVQGILGCLVDCGRMIEARAVLRRSQDLLTRFGEGFASLRTRWLEGQIAAGLGDDESAEPILLQVREGFREERPYDSALVSLELAAIWLRQGRTAEVKELVDETVTIFRALNIQREPIAALLMLRDALRKNQAAAALLRAARTEVQRLERLPRPRAI